MAAALLAAACNDSRTPSRTPVGPNFWTGGVAACFRVTGGGRIDKPEPPTPFPQPKNSDHDFATFGFHAGPTGCNSTTGVGEIEWVDHSRSAPGHGFTFHGTVTAFFAVPDHYSPTRVCASFSGSGRAKAHDHSFNQDISFTVDHACDEGKPGKGRDHVRMILAGGTYDRGGILNGGNIQQHRLKGAGATPTTGNLMVSNTTTGSNFPASYSVTVDPGTSGAVSQTMVPNGSTTFTGLAPGSHSVGLTVASNCTVSGPNPQTGVNVPAGGTGSTSFTVSCTTPTGNLTVTNTTTGSNFPPSYTVTVDPGTASAVSQTMVPNGSTTFTGLAAGSHSVGLTVAGNCTASGPNPQTGVNVPAGGTGSTAFTVSCAAPSTTGSLTVSNTTTGSNFPDQYVVTVDPGTAGAPSQAMAPNGSVTFAGLAAGSHSVALTPGTSCTVSGPNPQTGVNVPAGGTGTTSFSVSCGASAPNGTLTVTTSTTGSPASSVNYIVTASGPQPTFAPIAPNTTATATLAAGAYTVSLGVPANCTVTNGASQSITVPAGGSASVTFTVSCTASTTGTELSTGGTAGQIGTGPASVGNNVQTFTFDLRSDATGTLLLKDYSMTAGDGGPRTGTANPTTDPATGIRAFAGTSSSCPDPSRGAEFLVDARINTGLGGTPGVVETIRVIGCDNDAVAGGGPDFFGFSAPSAPPTPPYTRSGSLTSGDIVKATF